jgi:hypothetical protein
MDIMAMPWTEDAKPVEEMIRALGDCFTDNPFKEEYIMPHYDKPNGRVVYTMSIWADFHLDINVIQPNGQLSGIGSKQLPLDFVKWYSGMRDEQIESSYSRWKKEVACASGGDGKGVCAGGCYDSMECLQFGCQRPDDD